MPGFIHDKLEIKFLILYITARVIEPIPFDTVWDLAMCDEGVDYFDFAECLSDLVRTEHLTLSADGLYAITDKGLRNSRICESSLPYSVRLRCDKNLAACNRHLRRKSQVKASTEKRPNGTYTVRLELSDDMGSVMDLRLAIPREDMAAMLTERFQKSPERLYGEIMRGRTKSYCHSKHTTPMSSRPAYRISLLRLHEQNSTARTPFVTASQSLPYAAAISSSENTACRMSS